jgi:DNA-directed RNA polymerase specialized sigma24 family protein
MTEAQMCLRVDVQRAVRSLPCDQRSSVLLVLVEGLTVREAAAVMGMAPKSLHNVYRRGLRRLRHRLQAWVPQ